MANHASNFFQVTGLTETETKTLASHFEAGTIFSHYIPEPNWKEVPNENGELPTLVEKSFPNGRSYTYLEFSDGKQDARWYDWRCSNWGSKWAADFSIYGYECDAAGTQYGFSGGFTTAWSPASEAMEKLSELFPDATFILTFEEGGMDFHGVTAAKGGNCITSNPALSPEEFFIQWVENEKPEVFARYQEAESEDYEGDEDSYDILAEARDEQDYCDALENYLDTHEETVLAELDAWNEDGITPPGFVSTQEQEAKVRAAFGVIYNALGIKK